MKDEYKNAIEIANLINIVPKDGIVYEINKNIENMSLKLLSVTKELSKKIDNGEKLYIYSDEHENSYLCSENKTYILTTQSYSNSMFLVDNLNIENQNNSDQINDIAKFVKCKIVGQYFNIIQTNEIKTNYYKLKQILKENTIKECKSELTKYFTFEELLEKSHMSKNELSEMLKIVGVYFDKNSNSYGILDLNLCADILIDILQVIIRMNYNLTHLPIDEIQEFLFKYDKNFVKHVIEIHMNSNNTLDNFKVAIFNLFLTLIGI